MEPLFLGNHPALDFLNTLFSPQGEPVEVIGDGPSFLQWLARAELLPQADTSRLKRQLSAASLDAVAAEARVIRAWADSWISRWNRSPDEPYRAELRRLNGILQHGGYHREVLSASGRLQLMECSSVKTADDLLAIVATQIALLVTRENPALVRQCAGAGCTLWFVDRTRGHRRMFCSAAACGNRAKVAAFRARRRDNH